MMDGWQDYRKAPKDGTPILVDLDGTLGVFYWEDRPDKLGIGIGGVPCQPRWEGVLIMTTANQEREHRAKGKIMPLKESLLSLNNQIEPFRWRLLSSV